jgi:hypothetical protein
LIAANLSIFNAEERDKAQPKGMILVIAKAFGGKIRGFIGFYFILTNFILFFIKKFK